MNLLAPSHFPDGSFAGQQTWPRKIPQDDLRLCVLLARRAGVMVRDMKAELQRNGGTLMLDPDEWILYMDFALVHFHRHLKLFELLTANDLDFAADFLAIQRVMTMPTCRCRFDGTFPMDVHLKYANRGTH